MTNKTLLRGFFLGLCLIHCGAGANASGKLEEKEGDYFAKQRAAWEALRDQHRGKYADTHQARLKRHQQIVESSTERYLKAVEHDKDQLGLDAALSEEGESLLNHLFVPRDYLWAFNNDILYSWRRGTRYNCILEVRHILTHASEQLVGAGEQVNEENLLSVKGHLQSCQALLKRLQEFENSYGKIETPGAVENLSQEVLFPLEKLQGKPIPLSFKGRQKAKNQIEALRQNIRAYENLGQAVFLQSLSRMCGHPYLTVIEKENFFKKMRTWHELAHHLIAVGKNHQDLWGEVLSFGSFPRHYPVLGRPHFHRFCLDLENGKTTPLLELSFLSYFPDELVSMVVEYLLPEEAFEEGIQDESGKSKKVVKKQDLSEEIKRLTSAYTLLAQDVGCFTQKLRRDLRAYQHQMVESSDDVIECFSLGEIGFKEAEKNLSHYQEQLGLLESVEDYMTSLSPRTVKY
jgi:hypothetical protein